MTCVQVDDTSGHEQHTTTKLDGSQWSRSGEAVWISSGVTAATAPSTNTKAIDSVNGPATSPSDAGGPSTTPGQLVLTITYLYQLTLSKTYRYGQDFTPYCISKK